MGHSKPGLHQHLLWSPAEHALAERRLHGLLDGEDEDDLEYGANPSEHVVVDVLAIFPRKNDLSHVHTVCTEDLLATQAGSCLSRLPASGKVLDASSQVTSSFKRRGSPVGNSRLYYRITEVVQYVAGQERVEDVQDLERLACDVVLKYRRSLVEGSSELSRNYAYNYSAKSGYPGRCQVEER